MTRIVAGTAGGRALQVPPKGTRPTSDRVREALFSYLEHSGVLDGAQVLDLYAGSGALGLEAASRGADGVVLVEAARPAAAVCRRNVESLGLAGVRVVADTVLAHLRRPVRERVDLVMVDPPYDLAEPDLAEVLTALVAHLAVGAVVMVERSTRSPEPIWPAALVPIRDRRYGETRLWFAEHHPDDPAPAPVSTVGPTVVG
ncbi:16S rRNA (guanine(966)-N(2))-methyltransferase RsmD [Actinotalea sp. K2]|uniref:16S rRNA (guanine(966)-N(2))-methyltransferase RsmD n=1 Tax=Actinotalea sp. K2 TaxID=2939438 RepID=UPI002017ED3F|nr:16S rRNA (guanine(966)-N(2))-methyltransferase RsmD [Actinotalea sp. K2]MCL3860540.1 16S rRNA (guanine(966)-N(2))-methyltransferase RsmD [Actinotalea sp. K2]